MALAIKDRVKETSTTTGTGTYTLAGAVTGFETFTANLSNSDTTYYACTDNTNFEVGIGTFTSSGTTLARTTILASSNSNSAVNWSSGTRTIFCTYPADKAVYRDADGDVVIPDGAYDFDVASHDGTNGLKLGGTLVTSSAAELNILDGKSFVDEDTMSSDSATAIASQQSIKAYVDAKVTAEDLDVTSDSGTIAIDLDSETLTIAGGTGLASSASSNTVTLAVDAAQTGITSLLATDIKIGEDDQTKIDFETADTINFYAGNEKQLVLTDGALTPGTNAIVDLGTDALEFKDAYFDGTVEADAITIGGTALNTVIAGVTVTNATNSAHVLVTDNESTSEENLITFVEGATSSTGNVGLEMDGHLTYNPSSGTVTATIFKGNIDAVDGDFDGTLEADAITVNGATLNSVIADEATALAIALG